MSRDKEILNSGLYHIKPAANHILTVGKGIIKDSYTAILELVKNAYDADAENVWIKLFLNNGDSKIIIEDDGHGMDFQIVTEKWMVPSTQDKLKLKRSRYKKRPLQGRKGIGRYAASILGRNLLLTTTDVETYTTTELLLDWDEFAADSKYLEDVSILIENYTAFEKKSGTSLDISTDQNWTDADVTELITNLKTLLSPFDEIDTDFRIFLEVNKTDSKIYSSFNEQIRPLPVLESYHYRVFGSVSIQGHDKKGKEVLLAKLFLENRRSSNPNPQAIEKEFTLDDISKYCGHIELDIRAFDLDDFAIDGLSTAESKKQMREIPGIAVIREGFRVRPYGEKGVDWLNLDSRRYNNPTMRLSGNQVAGYVTVLQEDESHLEEKATREGFKEDKYYEGLKTIILFCLGELEPIRYKFRKENNKGGRKPKSFDEKLNSATSFENLNTKIDEILTTADVSPEVTSKVKQAIDEEAKEKESQIEDIKNTIAKYQGQVTLGKVMNVVFHEGRKPLNALKQHPKFITEWSKEFITEFREISNQTRSLRMLFDKIIDRLNDNKEQAEIFIKIFKKLEPLANSKRSSPKEFLLLKPIEDAFKIFDHDLIDKNILFRIEGDTNCVHKGWEIDFQIVFTNLIENSIHWLENSDEKHINIFIHEDDKKITIDYNDTGEGIEESNIENQDIFDVGFSTKDEGTGLGLAISGEALERNKGTIKAISKTNGANFIIELTK
ncbi:ATP-binding protein [Flavobacterium sp.]|uniref:ATP-binding protein n=1 Tax=Flavobacterium sp. TaxID=239 RepID=UPI0039E24D36